jgi:hypothetical protein
VPVSAALGGLAPAQVLHYQLVASNSVGVVTGADQSFTTFDVPRFITGCCLTAAGQCQFQFTGAPGCTYTVLGATDVTQPVGNWTPLGTATEISPGLYKFTDPASATGSQQFYRLMWP